MWEISTETAMVAAKPYFHELDTCQRHSVYGRITAQQAVDTYAQPDWCGYPNALGGFLGCFKLVNGLVKSETGCLNCDCYIGGAIAK